MLYIILTLVYLIGTAWLFVDVVNFITLITKRTVYTFPGYLVFSILWPITMWILMHDYWMWAVGDSNVETIDWDDLPNDDVDAIIHMVKSLESYGMKLPKLRKELDAEIEKRGLEESKKYSDAEEMEQKGE